MLLELPTQHRIPLTWLLEHGGESIRYRSLVELAPTGFAGLEAIEAARRAVLDSKPAQAIVKKQKNDGTWGPSLLGLGSQKDPGTVPSYRRLLQLGWPHDSRPFKLADRVLFRILSRDEDPALLFEWQKPLKGDPAAVLWAREVLREAASAALAEAGYADDPRLRGAAHKIANAVSQFLRSPLAEDPFVKAGRQSVLHPDAYPPTWYSVAMMAYMPNLQRERAGFAERLGRYLAQPAPKKAFAIKVGEKTVEPVHLLLGDPIEADAKGTPKDVPLALHYIELLARIGTLQWAPVATRVLGRLLKDCDERGVWHPKNLRAQPASDERIVFHYFPLHPDSRTGDARCADVTFRLARIAKLLGWQLEYV